ncbi:unnamed protein product [Paramecium octaurelia]|uniref:Uncharacterized protein n=1 Tax=Paramecium octaurelia TaxID=43137 RepID=A0A8S1XMC1_PAROT|nr:unnamed protein product [Paramecium octaurelia]
MENLFLQQKCLQHDQDYLAVQIGIENKYFCPQCLIDLVTTKDLILISYAKQQIQNKKKQLSKTIQDECQQKISLIKNLKDNIEELQFPLKQIFTQITGEIEELEKATYNKLQSSQIINSETESESLNQELKLLIDEESGLSTQEDNDDQLKKQILLQIKFSFYQTRLNEILHQFDKISNLHYNGSNSSSLQDKKTISQNCKIHNEQIKMLLIDEKNQVSKFSCVECISETQGKYISPTQLKQSFDNYQLQQEKSLKQFQLLKMESKNKKIAFLNQIRDMYIQNINLYIKQLDENEKSFEKIIETTLQFKDQNILQIEQDQSLKLLEPVYLNQSPNHFFQIIERQLEQDKKLTLKQEQSMEELNKFVIQNSNQIYTECLEHEILLKKLVKQIEEQKLNQDNNLNQDEPIIDKGILILENETNSFLSKKIKLCILYEQYQKQFENRNQLWSEQAKLIQKITEEQEKTQVQEIRDEQGKEMIQMNLEKKNICLERLKMKINSISFCNEIQKDVSVLTNETKETIQKEVNQYKDIIHRLEVNKLNETNTYFPKYDETEKLSIFQLVNSKLINSSQGGIGLAVLQPPLPNNKVTTFIFKINKSNPLAGVGICNSQSVKLFNYDMQANYLSKNHNVYLLCASGQISSKLGYTNTTNFNFEDNAILICQYDPKGFKLKIKHLNDGKIYDIELVKPAVEMSPCIMLNGNAEIEIM